MAGGVAGEIERCEIVANFPVKVRSPRLSSYAPPQLWARSYRRIFSGRGSPRSRIYTAWCPRRGLSSEIRSDRKAPCQSTFC
jgi:hypothetical protein